MSGDDFSSDEEKFPSVSRQLISESTDNIVKSDALAVENELIEQQGKDGIESDEMEIRSDVDEAPDVMEEQNAAMVPEDLTAPDPVQDIEDEVIVNNRPPRNRQALQRLTYYAPGHSACCYCGAVIAPVSQRTSIPKPQSEWQPYQIPVPFTYN